MRQEPLLEAQVVTVTKASNVGGEDKLWHNGAVTRFGIMTGDSALQKTGFKRSIWDEKVLGVYEQVMNPRIPFLDLKLLEISILSGLSNLKERINY